MPPCFSWGWVVGKIGEKMQPGVPKSGQRGRELSGAGNKLPTLRICLKALFFSLDGKK